MNVLSRLLAMSQAPLLMEPRFASEFFTMVNALKSGALKDASLLDILFGGENEDDDETADSIAVIRVLGSLSQRSWWRYNYLEIGEQLDEALEDESIKHIVFEIDSPGGECSGSFDLAEKIYEARGQKPITALVADMACSAAYLLASACDEIVISKTGDVGSVGVVATHLEDSGWLKKNGVTYTYVFAGDHKVDYATTQPLSADAKSKLQADVDDLYTLFVDAVAKYRNMSADAVIETQALVYHGERALEVGFADRIESREASFERIQESAAALSTSMEQEMPIMGTNSEPATQHAKTDAADPAAQPNPPAQPAATADGDPGAGSEELPTAARTAEIALIVEECQRAEVGYLAADYIRADYTLAEVKQKLNGVTTVREMCKLAKLPDTDANEFIRQGMTVEQVQSRLIEKMANTDGGYVDSSQSPEAAAAPSEGGVKAQAGWDSAFKKTGAKLKSAEQ